MRKQFLKSARVSLRFKLVRVKLVELDLAMTMATTSVASNPVAKFRIRRLTIR